MHGVINVAKAECNRKNAILAYITEMSAREYMKENVWFEPKVEINLRPDCY